MNSNGEEITITCYMCKGTGKEHDLFDAPQPGSCPTCKGKGTLIVKTTFETLSLTVDKQIIDPALRGQVTMLPDLRIRIGVNEQDYVEIEGKRKTAAQVSRWNGSGVGIHMDQLIMKNAGVNVGEKVSVRKADLKEAILLKLAPYSYNKANPDFVQDVKRYYENKPFLKGDEVWTYENPDTSFPDNEKMLKYSVVDTIPNGIVLLTKNTEFIILENPPSREPVVTLQDNVKLEMPESLFLGTQSSMKISISASIDTPKLLLDLTNIHDAFNEIPYEQLFPPLKKGNTIRKTIPFTPSLASEGLDLEYSIYIESKMVRNHVATRQINMKISDSKQ